MLHLNDLVYRIDGRLILDGATAAIPTGHKVGLVGRNGVGKTTLLRIIAGDLTPESGAITLARGATVGHIEQEAPAGDETLMDWVLSRDRERTKLLSEAETATDPHRIAEIQLRLTDMDAHAAHARAASILAGLGFDAAAQQRACSEFSGGWRMRVALAGVLFLAPDVLLLDEPTNYLDLEGTLWLETYLRLYPHTVVVVSHDRDLLNTAVSSILLLENGKLSITSGGYDDFEEMRRQKQRQRLKLKKKQDDERRRLQVFIDRFKAKATKARQAQSRVKSLARMQPIAAQMEDRVRPIYLPSPQRQLANPILRLEDVSAGYVPDSPVLAGLNLRIDYDDRIALLGRNGNGKSTFARLLSGRLKPSQGRLLGAKRVRTGYFAQHQLDELNPDQTPYGIFAALMPEATEAQKRDRLGRAGFGTATADTKCASLSGGEKARLLLAVASFHAPHLLILDEPTNHLDVDTRQALIQSLIEYEGALILISHDRHLVESCADCLWIVIGGTVTPYDGDLESYRALLLAERRAKTRMPSCVAVQNDKGKRHRAEARRVAAERRAFLAPLKKTVETFETSIKELQAKIKSLDRDLASAGAYATYAEKAKAAAIERGQLAKLLAETENRWLRAAQDLETAIRKSGATAEQADSDPACR